MALSTRGLQITAKTPFKNKRENCTAELNEKKAKGNIS